MLLFAVPVQLAHIGWRSTSVGIVELLVLSNKLFDSETTYDTICPKRVGSRLLTKFLLIANSQVTSVELHSKNISESTRCNFTV